MERSSAKGEEPLQRQPRISRCPTRLTPTKVASGGAVVAATFCFPFSLLLITTPLPLRARSIAHFSRLVPRLFTFFPFLFSFSFFFFFLDSIKYCSIVNHH